MSEMKVNLKRKSISDLEKANENYIKLKDEKVEL